MCADVKKDGKTHALETEMPLLGLASIKNGYELKARLIAAIERGRDLAVNADSVDSIDGAALQLLIAAEDELKRKGRGLRVTNATSGVREILGLCGLGAWVKESAS